jgi:hypothetical protein
MRKIREVLRLHSDLACTHRQIASACHISPSTVSAYLEWAAEAGLTWADAAPLTEVEVEARLLRPAVAESLPPELRLASRFPGVSGSAQRGTARRRYTGRVPQASFPTARAGCASALDHDVPVVALARLASLSRLAKPDTQVSPTVRNQTTGKACRPRYRHGC